ncbi:MAG: hypothetical protein WC566_10720 [Dehalococcoidia bacterium]
MQVLKHYSIILMTLIISSLAGLITPVSASAHDLQLKWHYMDTPGSVSTKNDILSPSEVNGMAIGSDGKTYYVVDIPWADSVTGRKALFKSLDGGISWRDDIGVYLFNSMTVAEQANFHVWYIAIAPDDINFIAVITNNSAGNLPASVWLSKDGGITWVNSYCPVTSAISAVAVSSIAGDNRDVAIGTRSGIGAGDVWTMNSQRLFSWAKQELNGDVMSLKFSPDYSNDNTLVVVFSNMLGTYLTAGVRDIEANMTNWTATYQQGPIEITTSGAGSSPKANQIVSADLSLPYSYACQVATNRRYFISVDCPLTSAGIYRFDDYVGCQIMIASPSKRICSIAYHGDSSSGKLLAGEVLGSACQASVMTWFTDSPFVCAVPCWYPAIKPSTGGAGTNNCTGTSYGNARVAWSNDGSIAFTGTASTGNLTAGVNWAAAYLVGRALDESAFSQSNNNGKTWAQLSLIDTQISKLIDIAPAPDCSKIFVASINESAGCSGFDSVWLSKSVPLGSAWERVLCSVTNGDNCTATQSDMAILRLAGDKPDGEALLWSAPGTNMVKWSINCGDSWNNIGTLLPVQDIAFEESKVMYILSVGGEVQRCSYTGTGWVLHRSTLSGVNPAYSVATAYTGMTPDNDKGVVIVGGSGAGLWDVAYSIDSGTCFKQISVQLPVRDNSMVIASSGFKSDGYILAINSGGMFAYSVYTTGENPWEEWWGGAAWPDPVTGITISRNSSYYFCTAATWGSATPYIRWSSAFSGFDTAVSLGLANQPTTRFRTCGGLMLEQPTITYAIDQRPFNPPAGGVWYYIDDLLWSGPRPTSPVNHFTVTCDPVTGRAGPIELKWLPRSLSKGYDIYIAKDIDFYLTMAKIGDDYFGPYYVPYDLDSPSLYIPPGGGDVIDSNGHSWAVPGLEAGHIYYWKVMVQDVATGDAIKSPWSWRESYQVVPGFRVISPYMGIQLIKPNNGCLGCKVKPASFSWSPWKETTKYQFDLAKDPEFKNLVVTATTTTTGYEYDGTLDYSTNYFWRVKALEVNGQNIPSDWSATFSLQTEAAPEPPAPAPSEPATPLWVWVIIAIGAILVIIVLVLVMRVRSK